MNKIFFAGLASVVGFGTIALAQFPAYNTLPQGSGTVFTFGGATAATTPSTTATVFDDVTPANGTAGLPITRVRFTVRNTNTAPVTFRLNMLLWNADSATLSPTNVPGPGTYYGGATGAGYTFTITMNPGQASLYTVPIAAVDNFLVPNGTTWVAFNFDNGGATSTATPAQLNLLQMFLGPAVPFTGSSTATLAELEGQTGGDLYGVDNPLVTFFAFTPPTPSNVAVGLDVAGANISGTASLADTISPLALFRNITIVLKQNGNIINQTFTTFNDATAPFSIAAPLGLTGPATIELDGSPYLRKAINFDLTGSDVTGLTAVLQNGDVDNSGEIDAADIDLVIADFGTTWPGSTTGSYSSDVDASGEVDAADIDIVIANFGGTDE